MLIQAHSSENTTKMKSHTTLQISLQTLIILLFLFTGNIYAQSQYQLNSGWKCKPASELKAGGTEISGTSYDITPWMNATVPGTVLTTQLNNHKIPDPFYGMNNKYIPDIFKTGPGYYTYWFVNDFSEKKPAPGEQVYLNFRGVNYGFSRTRRFLLHERPRMGSG